MLNLERLVCDSYQQLPQKLWDKWRTIEPKLLDRVDDRGTHLEALEVLAELVSYRIDRDYLSKLILDEDTQLCHLD